MRILRALPAYSKADYLKEDLEQSKKHEKALPNVAASEKGKCNPSTQLKPELHLKYNI